MQQERPLYSFGPSKLAIIARIFLVIFTFGIPFAIVFSTGKTILALAIGAGSAVLFSGKTFYTSMDLLSSRCKLYKDYLEYRTGWIRKHQRMLKYENIVDISYSQKFYERLLNHGTILITIKGSAERKLEMPLLRSPKQKYSLIKKVTELARGNSASARDELVGD